MTPIRALQDFEQTLRNYSKSSNFISVDPLITRLLLASNSGVKLYVAAEVDQITEHVNFFVFNDTVGKSGIFLFTSKDEIPDYFTKKVIKLNIRDILRDVRTHSDSFLVFNPDTENINLPITLINEALTQPLHSSAIALRINFENLKTDCVLIPNEKLDSERVGEVSFQRSMGENDIFTVIPKGKTQDDILKVIKSYTKGLDFAAGNDFHSVTITPFGREYRLDVKTRLMLALAATSEWIATNPDTILDIYFPLDVSSFDIYQEIANENQFYFK